MDTCDLRSLCVEQLQELCDCKSQTILSQVIPGFRGIAATASSIKAKKAIAQLVDAACMRENKAAHDRLAALRDEANQLALLAGAPALQQQKLAGFGKG